MFMQSLPPLCWRPAPRRRRWWRLFLRLGFHKSLHDLCGTGLRSYDRFVSLGKSTTRLRIREQSYSHTADTPRRKSTQRPIKLHDGLLFALIALSRLDPDKSH